METQDQESNPKIINIMKPEKYLNIINTIKEKKDTIKQWEAYFSEKINDSSHSLRTSCLLILYQLNIIKKNDARDKTSHCEELFRLHGAAVQTLCNLTED
jgi:hypothetical protein